ncbi:MAG: DUF6285 domain-containing protein [bacterium]|nr:DUF6285 domain-containing protein [bacterium]
MLDRPTLSELIEAAREHIEIGVIPAVKGDGKLYFQTLVALNVLKIAEREIALRPAHQRAAWARLNALLGGESPPPADHDAWEPAIAVRSADLTRAIRDGAYDAPQARRALFDHLRATAVEALEIANPKLLDSLKTEPPGQ